MSYKIILFSFLSSFILTYLLVPLNIRFSKKRNLLDFPHARGLHEKEVPLSGGFSFALPIIFLQVVFSLFYHEFNTQILSLALCGTAIMILGYFDDRNKITANYKLFFQILIVIVMYVLGFKIKLLTNPFGSDIMLKGLSFPFTIAWFLLVINAFNLIDGLDGLASGIAFIVATVLFAVGIVYSNNLIIMLTLTIMGSCLAFLKFNFYPAKIFMGDTGSLFIGFNIAAVSVIGTGQYKGITTMTLLIPIISLIIPLGDTFMTIFRRVKKKKNIFLADKEHLHHEMMKLGYTQKTIAIICYFVTFLFGLIAFGFSLASKQFLLGILTFLVLFLLILFYLLLKREFWK